MRAFLNSSKRRKTKAEKLPAMKQQVFSSRKVFLSIGIGLSTFGIASRSQGSPAHPTPAERLARAAFVPQNKSEVERLRREKIGWSALRASMIRDGASPAEAAGVVKRARRAMAHLPPYMGKASLWPIFARRMKPNTSFVWVIEAAAPSTQFGYCPTGMTAEQIAQIEARSKERCCQRVVVIQARSPFKMLAFYDSID